MNYIESTIHDDRYWYVIRTRPNFEKKVNLQIIKKKIETFLPLIPTIRIWSDRKKKIFVPLFPGYIFIYATENERYIAISGTNGAINYIRYQNRPAIVSENEINNIRISLKSPERIKKSGDVYISKGDLVRINSGIFKGLTGYAIEIRGSYKILVNIIELHASISIELNADEITFLQKIQEKESKYILKKY